MAAIRRPFLFSVFCNFTVRHTDGADANARQYPDDGKSTRAHAVEYNPENAVTPESGLAALANDSASRWIAF